MTIELAIEKMKQGILVTNRTFWQHSPSSYFWMDSNNDIRHENGKLIGSVEKFYKHVDIMGVPPYNSNKWEIYKS
jgi:hypothetical protein